MNKHISESDDTSLGDKKNVDALIAMYTSTPSTPRFDYIALESTHYTTFHGSA
ncbi:MAG: hypothetical protein U0165_15480 [Polyangiaceae bacterium]